MNSSARVMNLSSRQLLAFLEISRLQSFSKAAEKMPLTSACLF